MQEATTVPRVYGEYDVWDLFDTTFSGEIPCKSVETFFHLLFSEGSVRVNLVGYSASSMGGYGTLKLWGPITEDANEEISEEFAKELESKSPRELEVFLGAATDADIARTKKAFETKRLWAEYKLFRAALAMYFPTEEDRLALVE